MAFGITKTELREWKERAKQNEISFLTHFWIDDRFPGCTSVTKVACADIEKLVSWGRNYGLKREWLHWHDDYPHFDLLGETQYRILKQEGLLSQLSRFRVLDKL
ncbi:hypothetical protein M3689_16245 [Alkalihalophilus marmarensis]|uniref:DUF4031 domain-containing protein n=1 Tax=Alkalihalophilus marmarensis DSM 21297 TaxID=1188261 RepID=U6SR82_9BACI|nr:hypothetical protein [Alkalihalophilus marmarensis]ERN53400.1 hypothetical protein A33I_11615 [Alkalihalophilus marmarensis DSM 21297]MCM3490860.1 hypothetical protein [Alkalihalophilus marmarensis]